MIPNAFVKILFMILEILLIAKLAIIHVRIALDLLKATAYRVSRLLKEL